MIIFKSSSAYEGFPGYKECSGQLVVKKERLVDIDEEEVGPMYRVELANGIKMDAFEDELEDTGD